jgi:hypothetical protein
MSPHDHSGDQGRVHESLLNSRTGLVLLGFLVIAGFLFFTEHRAHLLGALVWLLPLACIFMHMFMHGGHGRHGRHGSHGRRDREGSTS